ncbi:MAG: hypothetical protein Q8922_04345 [Bacteroidota bacterium]|nr:hypothetical protein [Bacteroidota bacterium]MDP4242696.1 hypothetical protein [Bacteroidota bacterium]MDP4287147.1 hypothetical protein [Bacteroidota bacterium]
MNSLRIVVSFILLSLACAESSAQSQTSADTTQLSSAHLFAGFGGFIPLRDSYRINYSTNLGGLPLEVFGGVMMPISVSTLVPVTIRYERRAANFITGTSIGVISIEPGVRYYLEHQRDRDLRLFGMIEALLARATVQSTYDASADGTVTGQAAVSKDYFNMGIGLDVGASYPLSPSSAIDGIVHVATYLGNPVSSGGLGNIGGVSLDLMYRAEF